MVISVMTVIMMIRVMVVLAGVAAVVDRVAVDEGLRVAVSQVSRRRAVVGELVVRQGQARGAVVAPVVAKTVVGTPVGTAAVGTAAVGTIVVAVVGVGQQRSRSSRRARGTGEDRQEDGGHLKFPESVTSMIM